MPVIRTARLALHELVADDAPFILELVNDPGWLRFIGDRNIRTLEAAREYIARGPGAMYAQRGFGLWRVEPGAGGAPMGLCGLIKRDGLDDVDLGFAFLPAYRGAGHCAEAAAGTVAHARDVLRLPRLAAITTPDNAASIRVLQRLGFAHARRVQLPPKNETLNLFMLDLQRQAAS